MFSLEVYSFPYYRATSRFLRFWIMFFSILYLILVIYRKSKRIAVELTRERVTAWCVWDGYWQRLVPFPNRVYPQQG